jgi:bifunctional DNA-binding transcriptional regulator/antitoxin component of YhaV-PrlF toxin-antitoxin module
MLESTFNDTIQNTSYTVTLDEDGDDLLLPIPEDIMTNLGWNDGDVLEWIVENDYVKLVKVNDDGTI